MKLFVHTNEFKALNVGFSLDEGLASVNEVFPVYYAERSIWSKYILKICELKGMLLLRLNFRSDV